MTEPAAIYIAKSERTGALNFDELCALIDQAATAESICINEKVEVTNSVPFSGGGGVTVFMMQTYHPSMVDIIITSAKSADLLAVRIADIASEPKVASAIKGNFVPWYFASNSLLALMSFRNAF